MSVPTLIPGTLPNGTRRRVPKASQNRRVPLWTVEPEGEAIEGMIRVPVGMLDYIPDVGWAVPPEHTNKRLRFVAHITQQLTRWIEWRARRGWFVDQESIVVDDMPRDPLVGDRTGKYQSRAESVIGRNGSAAAVSEYAYPEEERWFMVFARFRREDPLYARLEDVLFLRHLALTYGVDPDRDKPTVNYLPEGKSELAFDGGLDPMQVAAERREALGLKRSDYLMGDLQDPL